jgi:ectoine hydroxylase
MSITKDIYASRVSSKPTIIDRPDPIVYSNNPPPASLKPEQVQFYSDNGFLLMENFFSSQEVEVFCQEMERLADNEEIKKAEPTFTEGESNILRSIFWVHQLSPFFKKLSQDKRILDIVYYFLNDQVYLHQSRLNFKPAFSGGDFYWHSDFETWYVEDGMPRMRAVSAMITLTENTELNAPLMVIPGSHKKYITCVGETPPENYKESLKRQGYGLPDKASIIQLAEKNGMVAIKAVAGSLVFFDSNILHGSTNNISPYPRCNLFFVYNSVQNALVKPFGGLKARPEFLAVRENIQPLTPITPT